MTHSLDYRKKNTLPENHLELHRLIFPDMKGEFSNVRESLWKMTESYPVLLHKGVQIYFDWLTGKPYVGQKPLIESTPWLELFSGIFEFCIGLFLWFLIDIQPAHIPLMVFSWFLTISGIVQLREVAHHCAHNKFGAGKLINKIVGISISAVVQINDFSLFRNYHNGTHHSPERLATREKDPENLVYIIDELGFIPGKPKDFYWANLRKVIFSPRFHFMTLVNRFKPMDKDVFLASRIASLVMFGMFFISLTLTKSISYFPLWFLPTQVVFQAIAIFQLLSEHVWGYSPAKNESQKSLLLGKCMSRFVGSSPPEKPFLKSPLLWFKWHMEMVGYFLTRKLILCLNLPAHSYHHGFPNNKNWMNEIYDLQAFIHAGCPNWPHSFSEVWGLWNAIDVVFDSFSHTRDHNGELNQKIM